MKNNIKQIRYQTLCADMKKYHSSLAKKDRTFIIDKKKVTMEHCDFCDEVNLWTYWQGRNHLNASILVVGQDWGNLNDDQEAIINIKKMNNKEEVEYIRVNPSKNDTDQNLIKLFQSIGYNIQSNQKELFFTNIYPLYRPKDSKITSGFKSTWLTKEMEEHFKRLVHIIKPDIIVCLGFETYKAVGKSLLGKYAFIDRNTENFSTAIKEFFSNPLIVETSDYTKSLILATPHPGSYGVKNRNQYFKNQIEDTKKKKELENKLKKDPLFFLKEDWKNIKKYIEHIENNKNLLDTAIKFAVDAHSGDKRKGTNIPYITHPLEALSIVSTMTEDENILAATVLHDVVEDTDYTIEDIEDIFGKEIMAYVKAESEDKKENLPSKYTWKRRKEETLKHLKTASTHVKMITLGDKLSNMRAIYRDYKKLEDTLWERFNQKDKKEHQWYYEGIASLLKEDLSEYEAYKEFKELIHTVFD